MTINYGINHTCLKKKKKHLVKLCLERSLAHDYRFEFGLGIPMQDLLFQPYCHLKSVVGGTITVAVCNIDVQFDVLNAPKSNFGKRKEGKLFLGYQFSSDFFIFHRNISELKTR